MNDCLYDNYNYLMEAAVNSVHLAEYPTTTYVRIVTKRTQTLVEGISIVDLREFTYYLYVSGRKTSCQVAKITHLGDSLAEAQSSYPELFIWPLL